MVHPFKFFELNERKKRVYTFNIDPPPYIPRRYWNMMPTDIREGSREEMLAYVEGWVSSADASNPYFTNPELGIIWIRGSVDRRNRNGGL